MKNNQRSKKNFFIKQELQGRLTWQAFLLCIVCILVFCLIFTFASADRLSISYDGQRVQVESFPIFLAKEVLQSNWIILLAISAIIFLVTVVLSHRIAGPIYHFEKVTSNMCQRNLNQHITLRNRDEATELANLLNLLNQTLSADIRKLLEQSEEIETALATNNLTEISAANKNIKELLSSYTLAGEQDNS